MQLELPDELVDRLRQRSANVEGMSEADVVRHALDTLDTIEGENITAQELAASLAVLPKSMEEICNGESVDLETARRQLKAKLDRSDR